MQWAFTVEDVRAAVTTGEAIESSRLVLAWVNRRPIHVICKRAEPTAGTTSREYVAV